MSASQWVEDIDETKDYYKVLGVSPNVSGDDLKTAYVKLAMQHHPDTAGKTNDEISKDSNKQSSQFIKVSEAWGILSRPEIRTRYDMLRGKYLGLGDSYGSLNFNRPLTGNYSSIPVGFATQKENFTHVQHKAGGTMEDTILKNRTDKWRDLPLSEKKRFRKLPVGTINPFTFMIPVIILGGFVYLAKRD